MSALHTRYYRQREGEPREEINRCEFFAAATDSGVNVSRPVNFRIGDVNYSYEFQVEPMTEEEAAMAKANWLATMRNPGPPKMLLEHDEPVPYGCTEDMIERRPPREQGEMTLHLPEGSHNGIRLPPAEERTPYPTEEPPVIGYLDGGSTPFPVNKWDMVLSVPHELLYDYPTFDWERYFREGPITGRSPLLPPTRRQRVSKWIYDKRGQFAEWLYPKIAGSDREERDDGDW